MLGPLYSALPVGEYGVHEVHIGVDRLLGQGLRTHCLAPLPVGALERIPALEGPPEPQGGHVTPSENGGDAPRDHPGGTDTYKRSWFRRFFGIE